MKVNIVEVIEISIPKEDAVKIVDSLYELYNELKGSSSAAAIIMYKATELDGLCKSLLAILKPDQES